MINLNLPFLYAFAPLRDHKNEVARRREGAKMWLPPLLAMLPTPVMAQVDPRQDIVVADYRVPPIIVVANGAPTYRSEFGQTVTEITSADIERRQAVTVADLLATTPGVTFSRNGGAGGFAAVRIRGAEGEQTLTLIDGVRVNDPSSPGGGFDFGTLVTDNISRIEILRGPNAVPWGSQALGGIVAITTALPVDGFAGSGLAEMGSFDARRLTGQLSGGNERVRASIGVGHFAEDGISAFRDGTERDGFRRTGGTAQVAVSLTSKIGLSARLMHGRSRTQLDGFPAPFFSFADTPEFSTSRETYASVGAHYGTTYVDTGMSLILNAIYSIADINRDNFDAPGQATPSFLARGRTQRFDFRGDWRINDHVRTVFGGDHESSRFSDGFSLNKTSVTSGFAQLIVSPLAYVTLTGGARLEDHRAYGSRTSFGANINWHPKDGAWAFRAAYGEGFKSPTLFQLYSFFGNTTLNPETAKSYEAGIDFQIWGAQLILSATAFQRDTGNQIDFISCFGQTTGICTSRPFGTYDNLKRSRARGIETSITIKPTDALSLEANYSFTDSEDRSSGLTLLRRPKHSVNASIDWEARDWLKLGASLQVVSKSADVDFQTFARTKLDGYAIASLRASAPLGERLELFARIENLFDTKYETVSGYGTYGRNAHIGVRARF